MAQAYHPATEQPDSASSSLDGQSECAFDAPMQNACEPCDVAPLPKGKANKELGARGEHAACVFLELQGFEILEQNWTCFAGEADIIAYGEGALHFIEVKTRRSECKGFPAEAVDAKKRNRYERIVECYLQTYDGPNCAVTFDVIGISVGNNGRALLRFHRNILEGDCR